MLCIARSIKGQEYLYNARSAHKVSKASAQTIADALNEHGYGLKDGETWYIHEIDQYCTAYDYAMSQGFRVYKGSIRRYRR